MMTVQDSDLDFTSEVDLTLKRKKSFDISIANLNPFAKKTDNENKNLICIDALVVYFDCLFENVSNSKGNVLLSTSPMTGMTHWYQTVLLLPQKIYLKENDKIHVKLEATRLKENPREYVIFVQIKYTANDGKLKTINQFYDLNSSGHAVSE